MRTALLKLILSIVLLIGFLIPGHTVAQPQTHGSRPLQCFQFFNLKFTGPHTRQSELADLGDHTTATKRHVNEFRNQMVDLYLFFEVTNQKDRENFIRSRAQDASPQRLVVEFENSRLKFLNDHVKDKDLITAIDNFANNYILKKIEEYISTQMKGARISLKKYSDGKSLTLILDANRTFSAKDKMEINTVFDSFQKELAELLKSKKMFRDSDNIESWFRMGVGRTSDEAYFAARVSRKLSGPNQVIHFSNRAIQKKLKDLLIDSENYRERIEQSQDLDFVLFTEPTTGKKIPSLKLFEILRKASTPEEIISAIFERFQVRVDMTSAKRLFHYAEFVDLLNPKFFVVDQTVVTLAGAVNGGIVVDRKGMGSANQMATALAAVKSSNSIEFLARNRQEEAIVTAEITRYRKLMEEVWSAKCRGDDCVIDDLSQINLYEFLNSELIKGQRVVFVPPGIENPHARSEMSTHGESIEKLLVKQLYRYLKPTTLDNLTFAIDFKTTEIGVGPVNLVINPLKAGLLDRGLEKIIQTTLMSAIEDFNQEQKKQNKDSDYHSGEIVNIQQSLPH